MDLKKSLENLGFTSKEIEVYLSLLKTGKTTPGKLSKLTGLNRPTVYSVSRGLISKGLISEDLADKQLHLVPLPPENLHATLERTKAELTRREKIIEDVVQELKVIGAEKNYSVPKIRFIEQGDMSDFLYHNIDRWQKTIKDTDGAMYGFQDHSFVENFKDWVQWADEKYQGSTYKVRLFSNDSHIEKEMKDPKSIRNIRFLEGSQFTSSNWVIGEYLVMIYTRKEPFYLVEIHDVAMAQNMKEVFKMMWKLAK